MAQSTARLNLSSERGMTLLSNYHLSASSAPQARSQIVEIPALHTSGSASLCKESKPPLPKNPGAGKATAQARGFQEVYAPRFFARKKPEKKTDPFRTPPSPSADRQTDRQTEGVPEQWYPTVLDLTPPPGARYTQLSSGIISKGC